MKFSSPRNALLAGAALTLALLSGQAASQQAETTPSERQKVFVDSVQVEVINIDVYVRDAQGNPIQGLTADDFELTVDGRKVAISNFYAVSGDSPAAEETAVAQARESAEEPEEPEAPTYEVKKVETAGDQSLLVVIYIDNFNLTPFKRNMVMKELRQFLRTELGPQDRVMLATYDRSLHLRHPFTATPENVSRAMLELEDISAQGIHYQRERRDILRRLEDYDIATEAWLAAQNFAQSRRNDLNFTLDAIRSVIDNLAASEGRKAFVYVSEGLPMIPGQDLFQAVQLKWQDQVSLSTIYDFDMSRRFGELANQANANRVSFYTIDAKGLTVNSQGTVDPEIAGQAGEASLIDSVLNSNRQSTIQLMAERTGGRAIINTNRFGPDLTRIATDFRNYYSLGYSSPDWAMAGTTSSTSS